MNSISERVLAEATKLADGDVARARRWYFEVALREFGGLSASAVVEQGRETDVLRLLEFYEAGLAWLVASITGDKECRGAGRLDHKYLSTLQAPGPGECCTRGARAAVLGRKQIPNPAIEFRQRH